MGSVSHNRNSGITLRMVTLKPRPGGRNLDPEEMIRRMRAARFAYVETSSEGARALAAQTLEWMNRRAFNDNPAQQEGLAEAALFVHFGDDLTSEGTLLSMLLIPGQPLIIEYSPQTPQDGSRALIARCARVLNYDIVAQPATRERMAPHPQHSAPRPVAVRKSGANFIAKFVGGWSRTKSGV